MLKKRNIGGRLRLGSTLILVLLLVVGLSALLGIKLIDDEVNLLVQDKWPKSVVLDEIRNQHNVETIALCAILLTNDPAIRREELARINETQEYITNLQEILSERVHSALGKVYLQTIKETEATYLAEQRVALELLRTGARGEATALMMGKMRTAQADYVAAITTMAQFQHSEVERHGIHASNILELTLKLLPALLIGAAILLALITRRISHGITQPVNACVAAANQIAAGDFAIDLNSGSDDETGLLQRAMARMVEAINKLISDTEMLTQAAIAGNLATRADPSRHQGEFRMVVVGINATLDAVIGPLNVAAEYVERIASGDIPPMITDTYRGDFLEIKNNLNLCIAIMNNLLTETLRVMRAAGDNNLKERANAELFGGDWKKLVMGVNTIISTVIQKNQALLQNEKMATLGQLAAGVAHEINNPMGYISSNLYVLAEYFGQIVTYDRISREAVGGESRSSLRDGIETGRERQIILEDGIDLIRETREGVDRVMKIVLDLKNFARMDTEAQRPMELNSCLARALSIVNNELKYVATVREEYSPVPEILCHPGQLNQVFLNLLVNAGQAMVAPLLGEIVLRSWHDNLYVYASVSDTGAGIPEEMRERILDPFFTTKEVDKGTGLGLSISHEIVRKHQGELTVESEVGRGTTFTVRLPRNGDVPGGDNRGEGFLPLTGAYLCR